MENIKLFVAVKACIVNEKKEILLLRESPDYKDGTNVSLYEIPGGRIDVSENLLDALSREVFEETGLKVVTSEAFEVQDTFNKKRDEVWHIVRIFYKVKCEEGEIVLSQDHDACEWVSLSEVKLRKDVIQNLLPIFEKLV